MRKITCLSLLLLILVSIIPSFALVGADNSVKYGDVNGDSKINSTDILLIRKHLAGYKDLAEFKSFEAANANYDTAINAKDALLIRKHIVDNTVKLGPVGEETTTPTQPTTEDENYTGEIELKYSTASFKGTGVLVNGSIITINSAGRFKISGKLDNGQIIIAASKEDKVDLILNSVEVFCSSGSPLYVDSADRLVVTTLGGSINKFTDSASDTSTNTNACIYSDDDLTINGEGTLLVNANKNNGIRSENDLKINGGTIKVTALKNGIRGDDSVEIKSGTIEVVAGNDGIKTTNDVDLEKGFVSITGGTLTIRATDDVIQAVNALTVNSCKIYYEAGGKKTKLDSLSAVETVEDGCFIKLT